MLMMMKVNIPVEAGNAAARGKSLDSKVGQILEMMKPEAAYFTEDEGMRTGFIFSSMQESSQVPAFAEPWFLAFNAKVSFKPAMTIEDLKKAAPGIEAAVKKFGS